MEDITIDVLVEIPTGSRNKYEYDKEKKAGVEGWEDKAGAIQVFKDS